MGCGNSKSTTAAKPGEKKNKKEQEDYSSDSSAGSDDEGPEVENKAPNSNFNRIGGKHKKWGGAIRKLNATRGLKNIVVHEDVKTRYGNLSHVNHIQNCFQAMALEHGDEHGVHINHISLLESLELSHHDCYEKKQEHEIDVKGLFPLRILNHFQEHAHLDKAVTKYKSKFDATQIGFNAYAYGLSQFTHTENEKQSEAIFKIFGGADSANTKKISRREFIRMTASMMANASATEEFGAEFRKHGVDSNDIDEIMKTDQMFNDILNEIFDETFPAFRGKNYVDFKTFHKWLHKIKFLDATKTYTDDDDTEEEVEATSDHDEIEEEEEEEEEEVEDSPTKTVVKTTEQEQRKDQKHVFAGPDTDSLEAVMKKLDEANSISSHTHHISDQAKATADQAVHENDKKGINKLTETYGDFTIDNTDDNTISVGILPPPPIEMGTEKQIDDNDVVATSNNEDNTVSVDILPPPPTETGKEKSLEEVMRSLQEADELSTNAHHISEKAKTL
jgi:hypothetical protein